MPKGGREGNLQERETPRPCGSKGDYVYLSPKMRISPVQYGRQKSKWKKEVSSKKDLMAKALHKRFTIEENELCYPL